MSIEKNKNFEPVDISKQIKSDTSKDGYCVLYPDSYDTDGFFICRLKKQAEPAATSRA